MADLFLKQAHEYNLGRPNYPESLFRLLASLTPQHELVWDVGTGNGQAAAALAESYKRVVATDVSAQQLELAAKRPNISYVKTPPQLSEEDLHKIVGPEGSVDLITVAQAIHWFDLDLFYAQVEHLLRKPGGVLAAWCYPRKPFVNLAVDKVFDEFDLTTVPYWAPQVHIIQSGFKTLPFPFEAVNDKTGINPIELEAEKQMTGTDYLLYLRSWSSVTTAQSKGIDLLNDRVVKKFLDAWGPTETMKNVKFQVFLVVGTLPHSN